MSKIRKYWLVALAILAIIVLIPLVLRWRAQSRLQSYRKQLVARGEKLEMAELLPKPPGDSTNTAEFLTLLSKFRSGVYPIPTGMRPIKPGVARVAWKEENYFSDFPLPPGQTAGWPAFDSNVKDMGPIADRIGELATAGSVRFTDGGEAWNQTLMAQLSQARQAGSFLDGMAIVNLHDGHNDEAMGHLLSSVRLCRVAGENPLMLNQLIRNSMFVSAVEGAWEALQSKGWNDQQLQALQSEWEMENILAKIPATVAMERATMKIYFDQARQSRANRGRLLNGEAVMNAREVWASFLVSSREGIMNAIASYPKFWGWCWIWSYDDELLYMETVQSVMDAGQDAGKLKALDKHLRENWEGKERIAGLLESAANYLESAANIQTQVNLVVAAVALERYKLAQHAYPVALADLVPAYLKSVPIDCQDGKNLRYKLNADGTFLLYSVGENGIDDGGDPTPQDRNYYGFYGGRDMVWPRPATADEVAAYQAAQLKKMAGKK